METFHPELTLITEKFPQLKDAIEILFRKDPDFRSLCEDYLLCINTLHKYEEEYLDEKEIIKEYDDLREELEKELKDYIKTGK